MPYAMNQGVRIHYELEGTGPPLVLQHGFNGRLERWYETGYVDALKGQYRLILIDARGHGQSDKPPDPAAYDYALMAHDVVAVLDDLGVAKAFFFGYSMGGRVGYAVARFAPDRVSAYIFGGFHPYPEPEEVHAARIADLKRRVAEDVRFPESAARALFAARVAFRDAPSLEAVLPTISVPCLVFAGDADFMYAGAREAAQHIAGARFVPLPGLDHGQLLRRSDLVLPHVSKFLAEVSERASRQPV